AATPWRGGQARLSDVLIEARRFLGLAQPVPIAPPRAEPRDGLPDAARRLLVMSYPIAGTIAEMDPLPCVYRVQGRAGVSPVTVVAYRDGEYLLTGPQQHKVSRRHRPRSLVLASTSGLDRKSVVEG